jgi:hypothetical protein
MLSSVPPNLQFLGDSSEGAYTCTSGSCSIQYGEHWYSSFNISVGATVSGTGSPNNTPLIIRSPGTCTIAGTFSNDARNNASNWGGGGGGGGGGTAAGTAGFAAMGGSGGGIAGALSGGTGGTGTLIAGISTQHLLVGSLLLTSTNVSPVMTFGGSGGGAGGTGGPVGGYGGGMIIMACEALNITGTISASGANGAPSTANNMGASGGGGGGVIILRSPNLTNSGTVSVTGGTGGSCGTFTGCGRGGNGAAGWTMIFSN